MADTTRMVAIPLSPGVREDLDRTTAPLGTLISAVNARWRKGGIGKANALSTATTLPQVGSYGSGNDGLGFAAGRQATVTDGRVLSRPATGDQWKEVGRASRFRPVKTHWLAFDETADSIAHFSVAVIGSTLAVAYSRYAATNTCTLMLLEKDGSVRDRVTISNRWGGGVVACGSEFVWAYSGSAGQLYRVNVPESSMTIPMNGAFTTPTNQLQVGSSGTLLAANAAFDVAPYNSTHFLMTWRVGATDVTTAMVDCATAGVTAFQTVACDGILSSITTMGTAGEPIWTVFGDGGVDGLKIAQFAANMASVTSGPTVIDDSQGPRKVGLVRWSDTTVRICWEHLESSTGIAMPVMRSGRYTAGTFVSGDLTAYHFSPASFPFAPTVTGGGDGQFSVWAHTDGGAAFSAAAPGPWTLQRKYLLLTPSTLENDVADMPAGSFVPGVELSPDDRATEIQRIYTPRVGQRTHTDEWGVTSTRHYIPALVVLRTQDAARVAGGSDTVRADESSALVLYEVEAASGPDSRHRQVVEVAGRSVVLGGHVQELYTQTPNNLRPYTPSGGGSAQAPLGTENGFAYRPAILSVNTVTNGTGLTADQEYACCATWEMVTPDGARHRSAPSNIVRFTPTGNNLAVDLKISTGPFTQREIVGLPNATVLHVYATTGNGNVFQRVTPDAGGVAALRGGTLGLLTYTHNTTDVNVEDNEALYTDTGAVPNEMAPANRFGWVGAGRLVLGGLFDPTIIEMSKQPRPNEPIQFTRDARFRTQLPEAVTGGAFLDNAHVIFTETGIYVMPATGPDDGGVPSLPTPQRLPSTVGCIDYRSIVEMPDGIGFQSRRGYELLPRGFGQPVLISGPVQDSLRGRRVISAAVTGHAGSSFSSSYKGPERHLYLCAAAVNEDGVRLVYDLDSGRWVSVDATVTNSVGEYFATWGGRLAVAPRALAELYYESPTAWASTPMVLNTADVRLSEQKVGRGRIHRFQAVGEIRTNAAIIGLTVYLDGVYSTGIDLGNTTITGTAGDKFIAEWAMRGPVKTVQAISAKVTVGLANNALEDVVIHSLAAEVSGLAGRQRVRQNRKAT